MLLLRTGQVGIVVNYKANIGVRGIFLHFLLHRLTNCLILVRNRVFLLLNHNLKQVTALARLGLMRYYLRSFLFKSQRRIVYRHNVLVVGFLRWGKFSLLQIYLRQQIVYRTFGQGLLPLNFACHQTLLNCEALVSFRWAIL